MILYEDTKPVITIKWNRLNASSDIRTFPPDVHMWTLQCKVFCILLNTLKLLMNLLFQNTQI